MAGKKPALSADSVWCETGDKQVVSQEVSPGGRGKEVQKGAGARYSVLKQKLEFDEIARWEDSAYVDLFLLGSWCDMQTTMDVYWYLFNFIENKMCLLNPSDQLIL